ncbi:MAG: hypothetical protein ACW981_16035 [Candidatus Hodarchaeales archaeon]|jgi:uncharacterized membrane protein YozB (DUF420 family)
MALDFTNPNHIIATTVLLIEIILVLMLLLARFNIRRLKINNHHILVYSIVIINTIIILLWMLPGELRLLQRVLDGATDPLRVWHVLIHASLGTISMLGALLLTVTFFMRVIKKDLIPLGLIKRMRPIMLTTFVFWLLTFIFGVYIYLNKYIL